MARVRTIFASVQKFHRDVFQAENLFSDLCVVPRDEKTSSELRCDLQPPRSEDFPTVLGSWEGFSKTSLISRAISPH